MNPYAYVGGNPETKNDPTGHRILGANPGESANIESAGSGQWRLTTYISTSSYWGTSSYTYVAGPNYHVTSPTSYYIHYYPVHRSVPVVHDSSDSLWGRLGHGLQQFGGLLSEMWQNFTAPAPPGAVDSLMPNMCGTLSFAPKTKVATSRGEKAIGSLHQGDHVWAYNPKTHRMELEPVVHVWINRDYDLVDVTISSTASAQHGKSAQKTSEVIHTNQKHPFLTVEKGFVPVSQLHVGMHVVKADGGAGTITMLKAVPGAMTMYNLEVAQDHTFTVGKGEWIVHNCGVGPVGSNEDPTDNITMQDILNNPQLLKNLSPQQVEQIAARDGGWVTGPLRKSGLQGETFNQLNSRGTAFTDKYIQWHAGGGRHGSDPIWKVSTNKGIEHVNYEGAKTTGGDTTGGDTTGGDTTGGDITDFIDP
jgi:Pretoxin HINT domain